MVSVEAHGKKQKSPQRVFLHGQTSVDRGIPAALLGCPFICDLGDDRAEANQYLRDLFDGTFRKRRLVDPPKWMDRSPGRGMSDGSFTRHAQALSFGCRLLDRLGTDLIRFEEHDLSRIAKSMNLAKPGWVSAVQIAVVMAAQNCVWRGRRAPFVLSTTPRRAKRGRSGRAGTFITIDLIKRPKKKVVRYLGAEQGRLICAEIRDSASRIAMTLVFQCGLRPGEPGNVLDAAMPDQTSFGAATTMNFDVVGKGDKERHPQIEKDVVAEIDHYRTFVRPERVENYMRLNGTTKVPTALLLNTRGNPLSYHVVYHAFREAAGRLGIKGVPHWGRHAYAADFLVKAILTDIEGLIAGGGTLQGRDIQVFQQSARTRLMENLGHAWESSTDGYLTRVDAAVSARRQAMRESQS